jgi:hypothetical protein
MFKFFKDLMKASEEARLTEGEDLQSIRELDRRLGNTLERRARGEIVPHGRPLVPVHQPHKQRRLEISGLQSRGLPKYRIT